MKHTFQILLSAVSATLLIHGCSYKDNPSPVEESPVRTHSLLTKSAAGNGTSVFKGKPKVITKEGLNDILSKGLQETAIKDTKSFTLKTIFEGETPLIHSVNFNGGGWALVAGRELPNNQIIAYGEEGSFDPDNIESPEVRFWLRMTKATLMQTFERADAEAEEENLLDSFSYDDPYVWVRLYLGYECSNTITDVNHLTETKWDQVYPWNYKCPSVGGVKCPVGCTAVAVAQLLYYLHFNIGIPSGAFHTVDTSYTWNSAGYYTSNLTRSDYYAPSSRWNAMAKTYTGAFNNSHKYAGDLLIDVADRLNTQFTLSGSGAYFSDIPNALSYYNIVCSTPHQYNYSQTLSQLDNAMPVLVRGTDSVNGGVHAWLIDGYRRNHSVTDYSYKWVIMPPDSLQYYNNVNYDYVFTDAEMQQFYPDIEENQIVHEYSAADIHYLRMNWGAGGYYNGGLYSLLPSDDWYYDGGRYQLNTQIITGFSN